MKEKIWIFERSPLKIGTKLVIVFCHGNTMFIRTSEFFIMKEQWSNNKAETWAKKPRRRPRERPSLHMWTGLEAVLLSVVPWVHWLLWKGGEAELHHQDRINYRTVKTQIKCIHNIIAKKFRTSYRTYWIHL